MKIKVSIIVPVYKVEKLIHKCVNSLLSQTLQEIEIILVNDGSPDNCGTICNQFVMQDSRIKVINKENGGISSARNSGIRMAEGEYIAFVDSDDYVENNFCASMYKIAQQFNVDIVNCDYYREKKEKKEKEEKEITKFEKDKVINHDEILQYLKIAHQTKIIWFTWRNIYRRSFLIKNNIFFDADVRFGEDPIFNLYAFYHAKTIYSINEYLYHYVANSDSLTQKPYKENLLEKFNTQYKAKKTFYETANLLDAEYMEDLYKNNIEHSLVMLLANTYSILGKDYVKQLKKIRESEFVEQSFKYYKPSRNPSINMRIIFWLLMKKKYFLINVLFKIKHFSRISQYRDNNCKISV